jgi:hypothetical protein
MKVEKFFTGGFLYPDDYQQRVIFGDHPYRFNISLRTLDDATRFALGDTVPVNYGYIRRSVMVKTLSNATIDAMKFQVPNAGHGGDNRTARVFSVNLDIAALSGTTLPPQYRIDPLQERIVLNLTNISATLYDAYDKDWVKDQTTLSSARVYVDGSYVPPERQVYVDGGASPVTPPYPVQNEVSMTLDPAFLRQIADSGSEVTVAFTFDDTKEYKDTTLTGNFLYDYNPKNVTQPRLNPGVMEVAVW